MKHLPILLVLISILYSCKDEVIYGNDPEVIKEYLTPYEKGNGNQTATYEEIIAFYSELADDFSNVEIEKIGETDSGLPLHIVHFSLNTISWRTRNEDKIKILINNGIHPGESDGIDASMMLIRDLAIGKIEAPENLILSVIPVYNVGGSLNRNSTTRTNQNGPESYGFRGNSRNYDLNRDFIKADTRNAMAFYEIFHKIYPDVFIDNHVSNGADYQYTLTHLFTQHNKLGNEVGNYIHKTFQPMLEKQLLERGLDITPYVNIHNSSPDSGFSQFYDYPRYSTGYAALWNTVGLMVETHMLKPYKDRVQGTRALMEEAIQISSNQIQEIKKARLAAFDHKKYGTKYPYNFKVDTTRADTLLFKGFEALNEVSELTGNPLLTYDRSSPFEKKVVYHNYFKAQDTLSIPDYYIISAGQWKVISLMRANRIEMEMMGKDSTVNVESYKITDYKTGNTAYEGHYPHYDVEVSVEEEKLRFRESDILIPTDQPGLKYIIETLEPQMQDSFFKWNFFDAILQQKEGFSSYVFEESAVKILSESPELKKEFDSIKNANVDFRKNNYSQLKWIHDRSPNHEQAFLAYPVYRYFIKKK
jgi:hypothetical protein